MKLRLISSNILQYEHYETGNDPTQHSNQDFPDGERVLTLNGTPGYFSPTTESNEKKKKIGNIH